MTVKVVLEAKPQVIRVFAKRGGWNLNWLEWSPDPDPPADPFEEWKTSRFAPGQIDDESSSPTRMEIN